MPRAQSRYVDTSVVVLPLRHDPVIHWTRRSSFINYGPRRRRRWPRGVSNWNTFYRWSVKCADKMILYWWIELQCRFPWRTDFVGAILWGCIGLNYLQRKTSALWMESGSLDHLDLESRRRRYSSKTIWKSNCDFERAEKRGTYSVSNPNSGSMNGGLFISYPSRSVSLADDKWNWKLITLE